MERSFQKLNTLNGAHNLKVYRMKLLQEFQLFSNCFTQLMYIFSNDCLCWLYDMIYVLLSLTSSGTEDSSSCCCTIGRSSP
mmetsp:Transcript_1733/g.3079  ORF Transcript_1733/g.3079 Transcript_1733/m.3079 type:complete len:81 (-) Transcript_1733:1478-1720(-)